MTFIRQIFQHLVENDWKMKLFTPYETCLKTYFPSSVFIFSFSSVIFESTPKTSFRRNSCYYYVLFI